MAQGKKQEYTVEQVAAALRAGAGIRSAAAAALGCVPNTIKNYIDKYPELEDIRLEIRESMIDLAEGVLLKLIKNENLGATIYYLKTQGKHRGWSERFELTGSEGKALPPLQVIINDPTKPPPEAG